MTRYPLVAYLDQALTAKVRRLQTDLRDLTGSVASMRDWDPHISVGSEVWLEDDEQDAYADELAKAASAIKPFTVTVHNFVFIDNWTGGKLPGNAPYRVALDVVSTPALIALIDKLKPVVEQHKLYFKMPSPYRPQVTIAFRDLAAEGYKLATATLKDQAFSETTLIDSISIARADPSGRNTEFKRIQLV